MDERLFVEKFGPKDLAELVLVLEVVSSERSRVVAVVRLVGCAWVVLDKVIQDVMIGETHVGENGCE